MPPAHQEWEAEFGARIGSSRAALRFAMAIAQPAPYVLVKKQQESEPLAFEFEYSNITAA